MRTLYKCCSGAWLLLLTLGFLSVQGAQAQTISPESLSFGTDSDVCVADAPVSESVSITLPPQTTTDKVDVLLLGDGTGSFASNFPRVASTFSTLIGNLETAFPDVEFGFGVARFEDYGGPGASFSGETTDGRPFILNQPIVTAADAGGATARNTLISDALSRTAPGFGGDGPESAIAEGLFQVATGIGFDGNGDGDTEDSGAAGDAGTQTSPGTSGDVPAFATNTLPVSGTLGGVGWRSDAQKIVIVATDVCSIAAFDPETGVPTEITGAGGSSEPVSAFACNSTSPGSDRFGFVSDGKSTTDNTVSGAVVPSEAGTVQATVDALNALGIQVVGVGPGAGPSTSPGPSFGEDVFLSALARLTGGVDSDGDPVVVDIGGDLLAALQEVIETTTTAEINIALETSMLPDGLAFAASPEVVEDVGPGGTASFTATFTGDGTPLTGAFDLQFVNTASNAVIGSIPATVDCGATGECDMPTLAENMVDESARTVSNTISDQDGIDSFTFSTLNNFTVASIAPMAGYTRSGDTWTWTDMGPAPTSVDFTLQAGPSGEALYFLEVTDACADPGPNTTDFDPPFDLGISPDLAFTLEGSYPNPTGGAATVSFSLNETDHAQLAVYDVMGRKVATLVDAPVPAGEHEVRWNGRAADGSTVASGVYLLRLQAGERVATRRLTVVR